MVAFEMFKLLKPILDLKDFAFYRVACNIRRKSSLKDQLP